ncbi:hypothetical protein DQ783_18210 [Salmonella enterica subsp. enterica serovar Newport]|uniref:Helix-turn-helix domain-containing protein n=1 Tax=Salmonella newport TaxID=108619 RepID=A0A5Y0RWP1_SALNE|nr:helix-turn-helix domain-containing protein [Salmonella enterica]EBS4088782.1 hypothetical protein [Salmonella enterica subsp. enterica serovar Newport]EBS4408952.1 hypothetical protein [Salmonella enterica subsp. enterica serovar Newport]EBV0463337.1 hypothetical protein [Salmonella enterica subsp. enterica serovar Newport]EBX1210824.1 hypothetical protein [Salmonella enterica subsp. enterica serovar Newport]
MNEVQLVAMKKSNQEIFKERLLEVFAETGSSQSALARQLNVTQQTVQQWCVGRTQPRADVLDRLAEVVGKPVYWFFTPKDTQKSVPAGSATKEEPEVSNTQVHDFLTPDEKRLLDIYRDLPGTERRNMLRAFTLRLEEIDRFLEELRQQQK